MKLILETYFKTTWCNECDNDECLVEIENGVKCSICGKEYIDEDKGEIKNV